MPRHKNAPQRPGTEGVRRNLVVAEPRAKRTSGAVQKRRRLAPACLRRLFEASFLFSCQRAQFERHIAPDRLAERRLPPLVENIHARDVHAARVFLARFDPRKLRRVLRVLLPERICLHGKVCSAVHRLTSRLFLPPCLSGMRFFEKKEKIAIDFCGLARYNIFLHETDLFVSVLTLLEEV